MYVDIDGMIPWPKVFGNDRVAKIGKSPFGMRMHPVYKEMRMHNGIDLGTPVGTPVHSLAQGKVIKAYFDEKNGGGYTMYVQHKDGYVSKYLHLKKDGFKVNVGDEVKNGQLIADSGNSGAATTAPHLHLAIMKDGNHVDPESIQDLQKLLYPENPENEESENSESSEKETSESVPHVSKSFLNANRDLFNSLVSEYDESSKKTKVLMQQVKKELERIKKRAQRKNNGSRL